MRTLKLVLSIVLVSFVTSASAEEKFFIQVPETEEVAGKVLATGKMVFIEVSDPNDFHPRMEVWTEKNVDIIARNAAGVVITSPTTGKPLKEETLVKVKWCPETGTCTKQYVDRRCWTCPEPCEKPETRHVYHWHSHQHNHVHSGDVKHSGCVKHLHVKRCCVPK